MHATVQYTRCNPARPGCLARAFGVAVSALLPALAAAPALAQPSGPQLPKQVQLVVPFAPGGSTDLFGRVLAQRLALRTGGTVLVENRPGAGGMVGAEYVSRAAPDGSVLMFTASDLSTGAATRKTLPFDAEKGLAAVGMVATGPMLLVVGGDSSYRSVEQLLDAARQAKGSLNYGSAGIASLHHLSGELLTALSKVEMAHVPYKGSAPAVQDLIAGRIQAMVASIPATIGHIKGGRLRALAVTTPDRSRFLPELPTLAATLPGYQVDIWWGVFAPGTAPQALLDRLNGELRAVVGSPEMRETFDREGAEPAAMNAAESNAFYRADIAKWRGIARQRSIVVE